MRSWSKYLFLGAVILVAGNAVAGKPSRPQGAAVEASAPDPMAPMFVVTSAAHTPHLRGKVGKYLGARVDRAGRSLALLEMKSHQIQELGAFIHEKHDRCGGFFAFATRAEAEQFIRNDMTAEVITSKWPYPSDPYAIDNGATVSPALSQVSAASILGTIASLSGTYPNRWYGSSYGQNAAITIRDTWLALANGRSDVSAELFACATCGLQSSVILTIHGNRWPDQIVVLGGHLDSINGGNRFDPNQIAPGADDDASGIATLTEVLRVAMTNGWKPRRTVKFMAYAAEEVGLRGSYAIAQSFAAQGKVVVGALQLDMTNFKTGSVDMRLVTDYSNLFLQGYVLSLFDTYLAPLGLVRGTVTCGYGCSDHAAWTASGYPSAMMFEPGAGTTSLSDNFPYIHTASDTLANMSNSAAPSVAFAKLGLAFMGELGDTYVTPSPPLPGRDDPRQPAPPGGVPGGKP